MLQDLPAILADHTPSHSLIELITSPMGLVVGGIIVVAVLVSFLRK